MRFNCYLRKEKYFRGWLIPGAWTESDWSEFKNLLWSHFSATLIWKMESIYLQGGWVGQKAWEQASLDCRGHRHHLLRYLGETAHKLVSCQGIGVGWRRILMWELFLVWGWQRQSGLSLSLSSGSHRTKTFYLIPWWELADHGVDGNRDIISSQYLSPPGEWLIYP